jgi:hypothetical protein
MRYRLDVLAPSIVDVVSWAGGWLFDRAMAGWDVAALVVDHHNVRPLQILGVDTLDLEATLAGPERCPTALAVAAELYIGDEGVRGVVHNALKGGLTEVTFWGQQWTAELNHGVTSVHHQLSSAARAFKAQALAAAAVRPESVDPVEAFRTATHNRHPIAADLICALRATPTRAFP